MSDQRIIAGIKGLMDKYEDKEIRKKEGASKVHRVSFTTQETSAAFINGTDLALNKIFAKDSLYRDAFKTYNSKQVWNTVLRSIFYDFANGGKFGGLTLVQKVPLRDFSSFKGANKSQVFVIPGSSAERFTIEIRLPSAQRTIYTFCAAFRKHAWKMWCDGAKERLKSAGFNAAEQTAMDSMQANRAIGSTTHYAHDEESTVGLARVDVLIAEMKEMDGFEASEGIVMLAATNRPDILDPALLRPGRFDRQVVVPLPELEDRREILEVHAKGKNLSENVDLDLVARGTPGMSGADLSNLINEAALIAVRNSEDAISAEHFEAARDRTLMGQKRESMALTAAEKEAIAYHEAGHALCAAVLPNADPLHKVTIIPSGMALGVTMQLPEEERHIYRQDYIEDSLVVRMGGRIAEELVFGVTSTGAQNDLVGATELARKMVREWGMSVRIGPMAWGSQNQVFLGDDLMHSRDYSDDTAREIDEEVKTILHNQEDRCRSLLTENRNALDLVARALLEHETISGEEVMRLTKLAESTDFSSESATEPSHAD